MRDRIGGWLVMLLVAGVTAVAAAEPAEVDRAAIQAERRAIVAATIQLDEAQAALFWPQYDAYRDDMGLVNERFFKLLDDYTAAYETLTDAQAATIMDEWLDVEQDALKTRAKWVRRFDRKLPSTLVARFFQLDNKMDMVVRAELARVVPLVR